MSDFFNEKNTANHKPWKKALCILLSVIIAFGTLVTLTVGSSRLQDWLGIKSMLSTYAAEIVDTDGAVAVNEEAMLADNNTINLENSDGSNTIYLFSEPISFTDENGNLKTKDISVEKQSDNKLKELGYTYTNGQNDYRINFSEDSDKGLLVEFDGCSYTIIPQGKFTVDGEKSISENLDREFEIFEYENIYGVGTSLKFYPQLNGVKDEIVLSSNIGKNSFSFELKTENCTASLNNDGTVTLVNESGENVQTFSAPFAYDSEYVEGDLKNEHYSDCAYSLEQKEYNTYILTVTVNKDWMESESTVYPIVIDPTTSNISNYKDAGIYSSATSRVIPYGNEATCCFGRTANSEYGYGRVLNYFSWTSAIKKGAAINSAYIWERETTGRTTTTYVAPCLVSEHWVEGSVTWENRPGYYSSTTMARKNINSKSTDKSGDPYWYKFNIASAVKYWADGTYHNYGLLFRSSEEDDKNYNWRAFASKQHSTSAYRPYTVINYTNDATAPTVTSVTGNATSWTKNNVTLTVNGAADNSGGVGLHSTPYSFSTTKGSYNWQSAKTKTFASNCTVYVYVRDAWDNIRLVSTQTINKIDKTAPSKPSVTGNPTDWTDSSVTLTASSSDSASGVKDYSFSSTAGTYSWQTSNTKTFNENQTVYIYARDNAGNISAAQTVNINKIAPDSSYFIEPQFYQENNLVGIYNPRGENDGMLYKIGEDGDWTEYVAPFAIPYKETVTVYAKFESSNNVELSQSFTNDCDDIGAYAESNTDFTLSYRNIGFDFTRSYNSDDKSWFYSTDSKVTVINDYIVSAVLPDNTKLTFVKTGTDTYKNEINGYTLTSNDNGYVIQIDDTNYHYGTDGMISAVSNKYEDTINITRTQDSITISDGANRAYVINLDSNGNIETITDPANNTITYTYDTSGNLIKVVDQAGVTIGQYSYTNGVLTKSMFTNISYNQDGWVTSLTDDSGAYVNYTYNDEERTVSTESSVETTTSVTYNDALLTVSSTDEEGNTTEYTYDEYYRTLTETSDGKTVTYSYDDKGNLVSGVSDDEEAENSYYIYDSNNNLIRQQTGDSYTYYVYNSNGENTLTATLKEDYEGEIPAVYSADLTCFDTISYTYDNDMLKSTVDSKNQETVSYTYDIYGNAIKTSTVTQNNDGSELGTVDCTYDILDNLLTSVSGDETSSYVYDKAGRTLLADEKGECTRTIYDNLGRTVQEISPEDYDSSKDGLKSETPSNTYSDSSAGHTYVYASNGTLTKETNRIGQTTKYFYNDIGSKIREEFDIYKFYYLNHGELYQVKVANVTTVSYLYSTDGKFLLLQENYANDDTIRYTYNDDGDVTAQYKNNNANAYVTYTYNEDGDLTQKVNTETGLKYVYGENNSVSVYKLSDNTLVQSYTETETEGNEETGAEAYTTVTENHFGTNYSYVTQGNNLTYTAGTNTVQFSYQTSGEDEDEKVTSDAVKFNGNTSISSAYTYDDNDNVTKKTLSYGDTSLSLVNEYDDENRITAMGYESVGEYFTYDENDQIARVDNNIASEISYTSTYDYDSRGNITSKKVYNYTRGSLENAAPNETTTFTYANYGWKDLLVAVNGVELTYDENGNVLTYGDREYSWNTGRHLESITDGDNEYSYTYDESGIRTSKTVNGVTTYYNTSDGVILSQTDGTNTMYFQYDANGTPLGFIYNGTQYLYMTNQMGDVISITDAQGNELVEYEYDEWGKLILTRADTQSNESIANINPIRYRGYYYDTETGYYYLQSRYYDPSICRFINSDIPEIAGMSKGISAGANLFAYCNNEPINNNDPTGYLSKINAAVYLVAFLLTFVAPYILKDKKKKYKFETSKIYIDKTGLCFAKIKYYKSKWYKKSFQVVLGGKKDWGKKLNINSNLNQNAVNYYANKINSITSKWGTVNGTKASFIESTVYSCALVYYLVKAGVKTVSIKKQYNKLWNKYYGIFAYSKKNIILCRILKGGKLNGWYYFY